jgi:hypothetical protein
MDLCAGSPKRHIAENLMGRAVGYGEGGGRVFSPPVVLEAYSNYTASGTQTPGHYLSRIEETARKTEKGRKWAQKPHIVLMLPVGRNFGHFFLLTTDSKLIGNG